MQVIWHYGDLTWYDQLPFSIKDLASIIWGIDVGCHLPKKMGTLPQKGLLR